MHITTRFFLFDLDRALARVAGEPWAWAEMTAKGWVYGRVGPIEFSWQRVR